MSGVAHYIVFLEPWVSRFDAGRGLSKAQEMVVGRGVRRNGPRVIQSALFDESQ